MPEISEQGRALCAAYENASHRCGSHVSAHTGYSPAIMAEVARASKALEEYIAELEAERIARRVSYNPNHFSEYATFADLRVLADQIRAQLLAAGVRL